MAKAKLIGGITARQATRDALPEMFAVRIGELWALSEHMPYPDRVRQLHDMRIAAKRLRYLFEFFGECFGAEFPAALKKFKRLQDFLGEVHDCDVWVDYLRAQLADAFGELNRARQALSRFVGANPDLKAEVAALREQLASGPAQGLLMLLHDVVERRDGLYGELLMFWAELSAQDFQGELLRAVANAARERPGEMESQAPPVESESQSQPAVPAKDTPRVPDAPALQPEPETEAAPMPVPPPDVPQPPEELPE